MAAWRLPDRRHRCFDQLPATIEQLLTGSGSGPLLGLPLLQERFDRVAFVYLDAFGWRFLEEHIEHALVRRARSEGHVEQLTSQFPSTTTAHMTTIHSGLPVAAHGVYEWHVYEPTLNRMIMPLPFSFSGDGRRETLAGVLDPADVYPSTSLYQRLADAGVASSVAQPSAYAHGSPNQVLLRGAAVLPFATPEDGLAATAEALASTDRGYALMYLDRVDSLMHKVGPDAPEARAAFDTALTMVEHTPWPPGTLVLLTADHGMAPVDPARTAYVNRIWPELADLLEAGADGKPLAPAGSCRDLFLHVRPGHLEQVRDGLATRLEGRADVVDIDTLVAAGAFAEPSATLRRRLGDVVVLPHPGEAAFWHEPGRFSQDLHGQHGGLSPEEMEIPLLVWVA